MLIGSYSPSLVVISLFVAILASYTALDLSGRIATANGRAVYLWITGGAIAMGHPLGATGAMITGTMVDELERRGAKRALVTLCIGGGMGVATIIERV